MSTRDRVRRVRATGVAFAAVLLCAGSAVVCSADPPAPVPTPAPGPGQCTVSFDVTQPYDSSFQAQLTVTNTGPDLPAWTVGFRFPGGQQLTAADGAVFSQTGAEVTISGPSPNLIPSASALPTASAAALRGDAIQPGSGAGGRATGGAIVPALAAGAAGVGASGVPGAEPGQGAGGHVAVLENASGQRGNGQGGNGQGGGRKGASSGNARNANDRNGGQSDYAQIGNGQSNHAQLGNGQSNNVQSNNVQTGNGQSNNVQTGSVPSDLATGASVTLDLIASGGPSDATPGYFTLNGAACNGAAQVPQVDVTAPDQDAVVDPGSNVTLTANAAVTAGSATIKGVVFSEGGTEIGEADSSPYSVVWNNVPEGFHTVVATAVDTSGATGTSLPLEITALPDATTAPQLHVAGNKLVDATGQPVQLRGVDRSGGEFSCVAGPGIWDGPMDAASVRAIRSWGVNVVRVPLNEACWLGDSYVDPAAAGANYQNAVKAYVALLHQYGIDAILDLHWTDGDYTGGGFDCSGAKATCQKPMPDAPNAVDFWTQVATAFKGDDATIFDLFNEPYPPGADNGDDSAWQCWLQGGSACPDLGYQVAGMQSLVDAVRSTGADNVIMLGGLSFASDLGGWLSHEPNDPDHDLAASWHVYGPSDCTDSCWSGELSQVMAQVPLIAGEFGEKDCTDSYDDALMDWLDQQGASYVAWTWNTWGCDGPSLINDYLGAPNGTGSGVQAHLRQMAVKPGD